MVWGAESLSNMDEEVVNRLSRFKLTGPEAGGVLIEERGVKASTEV